MKNGRWWAPWLVVACVAGVVGTTLAEDPPPGSEIVVIDTAVTELDPDYVEVAGDEGTLTCLLTSVGDDDTLFLTITTQEYEILIDDFTVLGQDPTLGMHWSGQIDGQATEGGLVVALDVAVSTTIKLLAGSVEEPDFLVSLTSTPDAAQALVRLWTRGSFGVDPGENAGLGDPDWPWIWYCGCTWGGGGMTLCGGTPPPCYPWGPAPCPPTAGICQWFAVWGVTAEWAETTGQD